MDEQKLHFTRMEERKSAAVFEHRFSEEHKME